MGGGSRGNQNGLSAAILHALLWVSKELDGRREIIPRPLVATGLCVACGDELDARLLEGDDAGTDGTEAAEADEGELQTGLVHRDCR